MKNFCVVLISILFTSFTAAETFSTYVGKIKRIYSHEREVNPYFGIELDGKMDKNPCGNSLSVFIKKPDEVSEKHFSMLMSAHLAGKTVRILNAQPIESQKCHGAYSTFNFVEIR